MGMFLWVDSESNTVEMCQSNNAGKPPWYGKASKITWYLPKDRCNRKEQKLTYVTKPKNYYSDKCRTQVENLKNAKMKSAELKPNNQKKKCGGEKKKEKSEGYWKEYSIVAAVSLFCYLNALFGDFVHDDIPAITRNRDVTGQTPILQVLKNDFWGTAMSDPSSHKSYRPLTTLSFR